jgi:uncharacterized protein (TIGR03435 family)
MNLRWVPGLLTAVALAGGPLWAQSVQTPAFEVASVKPNQSGDSESASFVQPGGRYTATNVTVRMLMKSAYGVHDHQIIGGPSWINTERFDIVAKAIGYATAPEFRDQARLMLRPLLADRFKLVLGREERDLPVYALVFAKRTKELGPQFNRSRAADCNGPAKEAPTVPGAAEPGIPLRCGAEVYRLGHLAARGMAISFFVLNVSRWTDRVVVNRTGLEGAFDWDLQWVPDDLTAGGAIPPEGPSLRAALREQAGFTLESSRSSIDVLVVERVERPQPD